MTEATSREPGPQASYTKKRLALSIAFLTRRIDKTTFEEMRRRLEADPAFDVVGELAAKAGSNANEIREVTEAVDQMMTEADDGLDRTEPSLAELTETFESLEKALISATFADEGSPEDTATTVADGKPGQRPVDPGEFVISDRYRFVEIIRVGGQAIVCRAEDVELERFVAVKIPYAKGSTLASANRLFVVESRITGQLVHPAVIPIYVLDKRHDDVPFAVMPYCPRGEFTNGIRQLHAGVESAWIDPADRELKLRSLLQSLAQVCRAVAFAHELGIVHRDIKPGNILIGDHGEVLLADWGLAKSLGKPIARNGVEASGSFGGRENSGDQSTDYGGGTPLYMSKEQALGDVARQNELTDVFLLGATLYTLIYGCPPFRDKAGAASYDVEFPRPPIKGIDRSLVDLCRTAMAELQRDRYPGAEELAADLERWLADRPLLHVRERPTRKISRFSRRFSREIAAVAAALFVGTIGLSVMNDRIANARDNENAQRKRTEIALVQETRALRIAEDARRQERAALEKAEAALAQETLARKDAEAAREGEKVALTQEKANFELASNTARFLFDLVARKMPQVPGTEKIRYEAAESLSRFYTGLMAKNRSRREIFVQAAIFEREVGNIGRFVGDKAIPGKHYARALKIWDALLKSEPGLSDYLIQKTLALLDQSIWFERLADFVAAEKSSNEASDIVAKLRAAAVPNPNVDELETYQLYQKIGLLESLGRAEELESTLDRIEPLIARWFDPASPVPADPVVIQRKKIAIGSKLTRANQLSKRQRLAEARAKFAEAIQEAEANKGRDQDFRLLLGSARFDLARACLTSDESAIVDQGSAELAAAWEIFDALVKDSPSVTSYQERLLACYAETMRVERELGKKFDRSLAGKDALALANGLVAGWDAPDLRAVRARILSELAHRETSADARQDLARRAVDDLDEAARKLPSREDFRRDRDTLKNAFMLPAAAN